MIFSGLQIVVLDAVTTGAVTLHSPPPQSAVILMMLEAILSLHSSLHVAVYVPAVLTVMVCAVAPLFHLMLPAQPVAVIFATSVPHILVLSVAITGGTGGFTFVIVIDFEASLTPQVFVQMAVYVPVSLTISVLPVAPVLHVIVPLQIELVSVAKFASQQIVRLVVMIGAEGFPPDVIVTVADAGLVPQVFLQVAEYVPTVVTDNVLVVAPVLHVVVPEQPVAVNVAVSVPQRLVLSAATVGAGGLPPDVIVITVDALLLDPQSFLQIAE